MTPESASPFNYEGDVPLNAKRAFLVIEKNARGSKAETPSVKST